MLSGCLRGCLRGRDVSARDGFCSELKTKFNSCKPFHELVRMIRTRFSSEWPDNGGERVKTLTFHTHMEYELNQQI